VRHHRLHRALAAVIAAGCSTPLLAGPDWDEIGDAGSLRSTAQVLFGSGPVRTLAGNLFAASLAGDEESEDAQDMFRLVIVDPVTITFFAGTAAGFGGEATFNTRLWLFDSDGFGLLANDDSGGPQSGFFDMSDDGTNIVIDAPGVYYLAITGAGVEPVDEFLQPIFDLDSSTEISGPDGSGGGGAVAGWIGDGEAGGYIVALGGAGFSKTGDLDGNGVVDGADLGQLLLAWGPCALLGSCPADLNFDGAIDAADVGLLLASWD